MTIQVKRIYEPVSAADGCRILVDRLWPRGIKKEDAHIDRWMKEIAPSTALRKWFHHQPEKWDQFRSKYFDELKRSPSLEEFLSFIHEHKTVTLLFAARDVEHNHALALREFINKHSAKRQ